MAANVKRLLLLMPATTYRSADFMDAAHRLGADVVVGSNLPQILETFSEGRTVTLDFDHPERAVEQIHSAPAFDAIVPVDEEGTLLAATLAASLKLPHAQTCSWLPTNIAWMRFC